MSAKRVEASVSPQKLQAAQRLGSREISVSLVFLVVVPYISEKCTQYWERLGGDVLAEELFDDRPQTVVQVC